MFAIFRRFSRLMAAAVGDGGVEGMKGAGVLELPVKVAACLPTANMLFICVKAS